MALATVCFAGLDATAKYLTTAHAVPVAQVVWLRFAGHVVFSAVVLWPFALRPSLRSAKPVIQIVRSCFMILTTGLNFIALKYLQLDQNITIFFLTPLLVAALAGPLLGEWVGWHRVLAIIAGFVGVLVVMHPGIGTVHWAMLLTLGATFGYALYNIATRYLAPFDPASVTQTYTPLVGVLVMTPFGARRLAVAGQLVPVVVVRLARLLGRARPLAADPRAPACAGARAGALYLSRAHLDVVRRLLGVRRRPHVVDAGRRRHRDPGRALSVRAGAHDSAVKAGPGVRGRPAIGGSVLAAALVAAQHILGEGGEAALRRSPRGTRAMSSW